MSNLRQQHITPLETLPTRVIPRQNLKLLSAGFSFFVAGTNDGSMGPLLPYMLQYYAIDTSLIALMFVNSNAITQTPLLKQSNVNQIRRNFHGMGSCSCHQQPCSEIFQSRRSARDRGDSPAFVADASALETTLSTFRTHIFLFSARSSLSRCPLQYFCELCRRRTQVAWLYPWHVWVWMSHRAVRCNISSLCTSSFRVDTLLYFPTWT